jgi:pyruvate ferredoxin oxidoreductase delta subunit
MKKRNQVLYGSVATVFSSIDTGKWRIFKPGINSSLCIRCDEQCSRYCPTNAIIVNKNQNKSVIEIDWRYCKGCGICANVCPQACIEMIKEKKYE